MLRDLGGGLVLVLVLGKNGRNGRGWGRTRRTARREHVFGVEVELGRAREDRVRTAAPASDASGSAAAAARAPWPRGVADAVDEAGYASAHAAISGGRAHAGGCG